MDRSSLKQLLVANGLHLTEAREELYRLLVVSGPLSLSEISTKLPDVDRASVYRNIRVFESLGIIHKLYFYSEYKIEIAGPFHKHPYHLHCLVCGVTVPLPSDKRLEDRITALSDNHGFSPKQQYLEIAGHCANCK